MGLRQVLQLSPKSPAAELSTLKLCNVIAAWVMEDVAETYLDPYEVGWRVQCVYWYVSVVFISNLQIGGAW